MREVRGEGKEGKERGLEGKERRGRRKWKGTPPNANSWVRLCCASSTQHTLCQFVHIRPWGEVWLIVLKPLSVFAQCFAKTGPHLSLLPISTYENSNCVKFTQSTRELFNLASEEVNFVGFIAVLRQSFWCTQCLQNVTWTNENTTIYSNEDRTLYLPKIAILPKLTNTEHNAFCRSHSLTVVRNDHLFQSVTQDARHKLRWINMAVLFMKHSVDI